MAHNWIAADEFDYDSVDFTPRPMSLAMTVALLIAQAAQELMEDCFFATFAHDAYAPQWQAALGASWDVWTEF